MAGHADCPVVLQHCFRVEQKIKKKKKNQVLSADFQNRHFLGIRVMKPKASICMIWMLREQSFYTTCCPRFGGLRIVCFTLSQWFSECGPWTCSISIT